MKSYKMAFSLTRHRSESPFKGVLFHPSANIGIFFRGKNNIARCQIKGRKEWKNTYKSSGKEREMANEERRRMNENVFRVFELALRRRERDGIVIRDGMP